MTVRLIMGDALTELRKLSDDSVHCVVTSPPYFGLRDYGTASWEGGDPACDHTAVRRGHGDEKQSTSAGTSRDRIVGTDCRRCGATRTDKQIGLEPTPAEFVAVMVEVFREVRRVLRPDGTLWLNLGDSYSGSGKGAWDVPDERKVHIKETYRPNVDPVKTVTGLKPKDLIGIPWRVAFALQADGWYLRQDIIWSKPNPMPESVTDRCTKAHEYLFLLSKSARYHYDAAAIAEQRISDHDAASYRGGAYVNGEIDNGAMGKRKEYGDKAVSIDGVRNRRSVWTVASQPFKEAHFATFPPDLIEPCILAGCPKDCCAKCGAPVVRAVERTAAEVKSPASNYGNGAGRNDGNRSMLVGATSTTLGWLPSCACAAGTVPGRVLDCFGGAGTTGLVADRLQRDAILIELNPDYAALARARIEGDAPLFVEMNAGWR